LADKTTIYRLRDKRAGLFSPGGVPSASWASLTSPRRPRVEFKKRGKTWATYGALKCHLLQYAKHAKEVGFVAPAELTEASTYAEVCADYLARVEIVFYDVVETEALTVCGMSELSVMVDNEAN
jgi:hypothetical protein